MSPAPARSTLITSAPNHANSCVQVGPDCTWVKSRMRTPSSALPAWPCGLVDGFGRPLPFFAAAGFFALSLTTFLAAFLPAGLALAALVFLRVAIFLLP